VPWITNLRSNPFEIGAEDANIYQNKWFADRVFILYGAQALVGMYLKTFEEFPPRQKPASFSVDEALEKARQKQKLLEGNVGVK